MGCCYEREFEIRNIAEYLEAIHTINDSRLGEFYYRGQSNEDYKLLPHICREIKGSDKKYLELEKEIVSESLLKYTNVFCNYTSNIELLTQLQHYGVPTRLLDVTSNPLVALYFACSSKQDKNGEVFVFKMDAINPYDYEGIEALSSIGFKNHQYPLDFDEYLEESGVKLKLSVNMHTSNYEQIMCTAMQPILIKTKSFFERQRAQSGYYILFVNYLGYGEHPIKSGFSSQNGYYFEDRIDEIDKGSSPFITNIIKIPNSCKKEICLQLKSLNIDVSTLFPEDIDRGCKMLVDDICERSLKEIVTL
ncbi:FRG domain-containing protein [Ruminococcus flavefaciens]|uniref:FRG domain-containing protein n=1 Tax=Ruminococcus flavefaciens TaxID=1265 RepID=UPI000491318C|nr:FRG domain-containing protein [Ruminococcus flavefaciens]